MKRAQRRYHFADYEDLHRHAGWRRVGEEAPCRVRVLPVAPEPAAISSVLVFKPDEIGDAVYALPAIAELKRHLPHARLCLACRSLTKPLYERTGLFDEIATMDAPTRNPLQRPRLPAFGGEPRPRRLPAHLSARLPRLPAHPRPRTLHPADPRMRSSSVYRAHVSLWSEERRHMALQMFEIVGLLTGHWYGFEDVVCPAFAWTNEDAMALDRAA